MIGEHDKTKERRKKKIDNLIQAHQTGADINPEPSDAHDITYAERTLEKLTRRRNSGHARSSKSIVRNPNAFTILQLQLRTMHLPP
jgi:hypothetical protein